MEEQQTGKGTARGALKWRVRGRWLGNEGWAAPCHGTLGSAQPEKLQVQPWLTTGLGVDILQGKMLEAHLTALETLL